MAMKATITWHGVSKLGNTTSAKSAPKKSHPPLHDGQEIIFGRGDPNGQVIDKPNPEYCNIKFAIARAIHACGAADIIAEMDWDDDEDEAIVNQPVYFGGPFVPDGTLFRRLENRLLTVPDLPCTDNLHEPEITATSRESFRTTPNDLLSNHQEQWFTMQASNAFLMPG
ncbi:hypothetical protein M413DRAFT_30953 [Hebeloma cylindrosporum]|uniref:Uncharacterized protein n=1 Tax=Hebeloma cylindrosporum TaxID=76867 RepID=A0A0C3BLA3_HEBCY|nr:hypothetical protein M413DRAFT_30953 [Hebeloma cylindrosporum h7]